MADTARKDSRKDHRIDNWVRKISGSSETLERLVYGYQFSRTMLFTGQLLSLPVVEFLTRGSRQEQPPDFKLHFEVAFQDLLRLLKSDARNIRLGLYPVDVLEPENPMKFWLRYPKILWDGYQVARRRDDKDHSDFKAEEKQYFEDVPEYYKRNFHFQTGGYLSEKSAELYEHQVEILFSGAADPMRRLILAPMKEHITSGDGEGLHFLEVASGTGRLTRFVKLAFPKAKITCVDLSEPYLKKARQSLGEGRGIQFMQGDAAHLPFREAQFDAVISCFLFHELPQKERQKVLAESMRVLKPGGFCGMVDSIQLGDFEELDWGIRQFPTRFHEPFYTNYIQTPMQPMFEDTGLEECNWERGFFSKVVYGLKPKMTEKPKKSAAKSSP